MTGKIRQSNFLHSAIAVGLILLLFVIFGNHDLPFMMLSFILVQMLAILTSISLILLRITALLKNKNGWYYYFSGTIQACLCIMDIILLFNQSLIKSSLLIFLTLNSMLAAIIFYDIYKPSYAKGNIAGDPGSQTTDRQNNGPGNRKPIFEGGVEQCTGALPETVD